MTTPDLAGKPLPLAYASRTGTRRNLAALRNAGWRLILSPRGVMRDEGFRYGLDNGAWTAFQRQQSFQVAPFLKALRTHGDQADWTVLPDIVAGGKASLELSIAWMPTVLGATSQALLAVQDGIDATDILPWIGPCVGIFVGGSTSWKLATLPVWGALGLQRQCWVHVGRVNTARRVAQCVAAGVTSFDGSSVSRYSVTLPLLDRARHQMALF